MEKTGRKSFLEGALVLMCAMVVVKIIGALFKIPLTNILGGVGMSYFSAAYDLFNPIYSISVAGLPVAVSKMVSQFAAQGRYRDVRRVLRCSFVLFVITGVAGFCLIFFGAGPFTHFVNNSGAYYAVVCISPAILFGCLMAAVRGYYQGLSNMVPTALSQVIEAVTKLTAGILLAYGVTAKGISDYEATGMLFGRAVESLERAQIEVLPYSAAAAILGVTASTAAGAAFLWLRHKLKGDGITRRMVEGSPRAHSGKRIMKRLVLIALPVCLGSLTVNLTTLIDLASIMSRLTSAMERAPEVILQMYQAYLPASIENSEVPRFLYGSYTGLTVSLFNLVPALTTTLGISALPTISAAWTRRDRALIKSNVESVLRVTAMVAIPAGLGLSALADPILHLLFAARPNEATIVVPLMRVMGISAILVALSAPINSMLQAVGRVSVPVRLMLIGGILKLATNFTLVAIPSVNIKGAPFGNIFCYTAIVCLSLYVLVQTTHIRLNYRSVFLKPLFAGLMCAAAAWASYGIISRLISSRLDVFLAIGIGGLVYAAVLLLTKTITREDVLLLPKGEKIAKILAKRSLLG